MEPVPNVLELFHRTATLGYLSQRGGMRSTGESRGNRNRCCLGAMVQYRNSFLSRIDGMHVLSKSGCATRRKRCFEGGGCPHSCGPANPDFSGLLVRRGNGTPAQPGMGDPIARRQRRRPSRGSSWLVPHSESSCSLRVLARSIPSMEGPRGFLGWPIELRSVCWWLASMLHCTLTALH
jgi:hypothetical protein